MEFLNWFAEHYILGIVILFFIICCIEMICNTVIYILRPQLGFHRPNISSLDKKDKIEITEAKFEDI
jgi:hypothetical protein